MSSLFLLLISIIEFAIIYFILNRSNYIISVISYIIMNSIILIISAIIGIQFNFFLHFIQIAILGFLLIFILNKIIDIFDYDSIVTFIFIGIIAESIIKLILSLIF